MLREYHKWYSPILGRDIELLVFGHSGVPLLVFPTSMGRFFDYESRGMIDVISHKYENGDSRHFASTVSTRRVGTTRASPHASGPAATLCTTAIWSKGRAVCPHQEYIRPACNHGCSFGGYTQ